MANSTAKAVIRMAVLQKGYCEKPAGSNRTKFGKFTGTDGEAWCASFEVWCGDKAAGSNPIGFNASAAYIQEATVAKGGSWIMKKTASKSARKSGQAKAKLGDIVSFDFGAFDCWRDHTAFVIGRSGTDYICIEGNTSATERGSQNNGGCVAIRRRKYTDVCSIVRPKYGVQAEHKISRAYTGTVPKVPGRGYFNNKDKCSNVKALQSALNWASGAGVETDGAFGNETLFGVIWFQTMYGLTPDGKFGTASLKKLKSLISKHKATGNLEVVGKVDEPTTKTMPKKVKKTKAQRIVETAKKDAWGYGTKRSYCRYPDGKRKKHYGQDLKKAYGSRKSWGKQTRAGASCDVFMGTVVRASEVDKKCPRGLDEQFKYFKKPPKGYKRVSRKKMKAGDLILQKKKTGAGHAMIYLGNGLVANAHYCGKTYPLIEKASKVMWPASKCKIFWVIRAV